MFDQDTWTNYYLITSGGPAAWRDSLTVPVPPALSMYGANVTPIDLDARIAAYTGTMRPNPFYKEPGHFQGRREMRLQAKITF